MRHRVSGKHLGRTSSHRRALRRNMAASLLEHGAIRTTVIKAKELRRFVEKLITAAKADTLHARRRVIAELQDRLIEGGDGEQAGQTVVQKLFDEIAPRYADRNGGYTRIIRLPDRRIGDAGKQVLLQLVEETAARETAEPGKGSRRRRAAEKRIEAAGDLPTAEAETQQTDPQEADPQQPAADEPAEQAPESPEALESPDAADDSDQKS